VTKRRWLQRDDLGLPTFWPLQLIGWSGFYILNLLSNLPTLDKPGTISDNTAYVVPMFAMSCLLWPVCRGLRRRQSSWIALESRAFAWSLLLGALSGLVSELWLKHTVKTDWQGVQDLLGMMLFANIALFMWCNLYFSIKQWQEAARAQQRLLRAESEARQARLSALRYQLSPHLLFNSLNAVSTLVLDGKATEATTMLARLAELLRSVLDAEPALETPFSQEIAFTRQYLAIEQVRLGERLRVEIDAAPDTLDALVPGMLLQPLVENAVRHGIAPVVAGGSIRIESRLAASRLRIELRNSGEARPGAALRNHSMGIGLTNTAERLKTLYGAEHRFVLQWPEDGGCHVLIELPFRVQPVMERAA